MNEMFERKKPEYIKTYEKLEKDSVCAINSLGDQSMRPKSNMYMVCLKNYSKAKQKLDEYNSKMNEMFESIED